MYSMITLVADYAALLGDATSLVDGIRSFIAPIVLLATSIAALTFLFRRQMMQMLIFAVASIVVYALFWAPEMLGNLGKTFGESNKGLTWN